MLSQPPTESLSQPRSQCPRYLQSGRKNKLKSRALSERRKKQTILALDDRNDLMLCSIIAIHLVDTPHPTSAKTQTEPSLQIVIRRLFNWSWRNSQYKSAYHHTKKIYATYSWWTQFGECIHLSTYVDLRIPFQHVNSATWSIINFFHPHCTNKFYRWFPCCKPFPKHSLTILLLFPTL